MAGLEAKSFDRPDEVRPFKAHGHTDIVKFGGTAVARGTYEPGWRWSQDVKPIAGTDSCQVPHAGYVISGRLGVRMDDGTEIEAGPGEAVIIAPGHDGWVIGDEPCVLVDFGAGVPTFAKPA